MPVPKSKWLTLPKAARGKKTYQEYVNWTARKTAQRTRAAAARNIAGGALEPLTQAQIQAQATRQVRSQTAPVISQITASINRQKAASLADLNRSIDNTLNAIAPVAGQVGGAYDTSISQMRNVGQGVTNLIGQTGASTQQSIHDQLAAAGLSPSESFDLGKTTDFSKLAAAGGSADAVNAALADRASEMAYLAKVPLNIRRMGMQNRATLQTQYANNLADQIGQITGQVPSMVNTAYQSLLDREYNKAVAKQGFLMDTARLAETHQQNVDALAAAKNKKAAAANPKINSAVSNNANDGYARDSNGNPIPDGRGGYVPWTPHTAKPPTGKTPTEKFQKRVSDADKRAYAIAAGARKDMVTRLNPPPGTVLGPGQGFKKPGAGADDTRPTANAYIKQKRASVVNQMFSFWRGAFPGKDEDWIRKHVATSLGESGWAVDAKNLGYGGATVTSVAPPRTGRAPRGAQSAGGPQPPPTPATVTPGKPAKPVPGRGGKVPITKATPQVQTNFNKRVLGRGDYWSRIVKGGSTAWQNAYGQLSNDILRIAYSMGVAIQPAQAFALADRILQDSGVVPRHGGRAGNPRGYDSSYKQWVPKG